MPERKQTPDVLGEILGEAAPDQYPAAAGERRAPARAARRAGEVDYSTPAARDPQLPRWDHQIVSFQNYRGWRPRYVDGAELPEWMAGPLMHDYLKALGAEGWEVAGAASGHPLYGSADGYQVIFKRLKR